MQPPPLPVPLEGALLQNYPNPFNPATTISFTIPVPAQVTLRVLDLLGREVDLLLAGHLPAGAYTRQWNAVVIPGGVYYCQLQAGAFRLTRKMVLLK
ncbi:MAG TPA: T9SS type A sorting domain-containing protein [bacterium]|nr:T9SS type A sorting domain-containing protein [bacterium]